MSVGLLLIITIIAFLIIPKKPYIMLPLPPQFKLFMFALINGISAWLILALFLMLPLVWYLVGLVVIWGFSRVFFMNIFKFRHIHGLFFFGLIVIPMFFSGIGLWTSGLTNAERFNQLVTNKSGMVFNTTIPDNMVRLITPEYATNIAQQHLSSFGSNVFVNSAHIMVYEGRLSWACEIVSTNTLSENYVKGFLIIDANDPTKNPTLINRTMPIGEGLFWDHDIFFRNYLADTSIMYEQAYVEVDDLGHLAYVLTRTRLNLNLIEEPLGPIVYFENGTIKTYDSIYDVPEFIERIFSEQFLERDIARWGDYRRDGGFDLFAGGFLWVIPPSRERVEISEDLRYILDPDTNEIDAMVAVHPVSSEKTLAGVFKISRSNVYYYDYKDLNLISGITAMDVVESELPKPATGFYYAAMPMLYPVEVSPNNFKLTWYVPVYWQEYSDEESTSITIRLAGLALVDASKSDNRVLELAVGGLTGEALVRSARLKYIALFGGTQVQETINIIANITGYYSYVKDGVTHIVIQTNNSTYRYLEGWPDTMPLQDWYTLLSANVGDTFNATINVSGEQYVITAFKIV